MSHKDTEIQSGVKKKCLMMVDLGAVSRMITNITNFKNFDDSFQECGLFYLKFVK